MKWLLLVVAILVGVILLALLVGALLPRDHRAARSVVIRQPPAALWAVITDYGAAPSWRPDIARVERVQEDPRRDVWREVDRHGNAIPYETLVEEPQRRLVRRIADEKLPFGGTWTFELAPDGHDATATTVTIQEDGFVSNPMYRFVSVLIIGQNSNMDGYLKNLGHKFGETVVPSPAAHAST